jgi:HEAT repeat protein
MREGEHSVQEELKQALVDLRQGREPAMGLFDAIHAFGEQQVVEAVPVIHPYLQSDDPDIRYITLHVLTMHFRLAEYTDTALEMLEHDPDETCRRWAAAGLLSLKADTQDRRVLAALARVVANEHEERIVRLAAYSAMRGIMHYDSNEQLALASDAAFDIERDVDWNFVRSFLA